MKRISVVLCCAALVAGACGSKASIEEVVAASADNTVKAKTARTEVTTTIEGDSTITNVSDGVIDFSHHLTQMNVKANGLSITAVTDGKAIYEKFPPSAGLPAGKPWLKLTFDEIGKNAGIEGLGSLTSAENDPASSLSALRGVGAVTKVGNTTLRGEKTTHYHAVLDYEQAAAKATKEQAAALRSTAKALGTKTQPIDVWIDGDGRVRKYSEKIDMTHATLPAGNTAQLPKSTSVSAEYYDFGTKVDITIPPASETTNFSDAFGDEGEEDDTPRTTVVETPATTTLASKMLSTVLPGYKLEPDDVGDTGPSDLDKAVRDDAEDDARQALTTAGFVAGYQRYWTKGDNEIVAIVYQFKTAAGATSYIQRGEAQIEGEVDGPATPFGVTTIPGAKGYALKDGSDVGAIIAFSRGVYAVELIVNGTDATAANATQLAKAQYDKLG